MLVQHLKQFMIRWLKRQFHGNPIVNQPGEYLPKVGQALSVGIIASVSLVVLAFIGFTFFVITVLYGWF